MERAWACPELCSAEALVRVVCLEGVRTCNAKSAGQPDTIPRANGPSSAVPKASTARFARSWSARTAIKRSPTPTRNTSKSKRSHRSRFSLLGTERPELSSISSECLFSVRKLACLGRNWRTTNCCRSGEIKVVNVGTRSPRAALAPSEYRTPPGAFVVLPYF